MLGLADFLRRLTDTYGQSGAQTLTPLIDALNGLDASRDLAPDSATLRSFMNDLHSQSFALADRINQRFFSHGEEIVQQMQAA